jgi:hypothetical protein
MHAGLRTVPVQSWEVGLLDGYSQLRAGVLNLEGSLRAPMTLFASLRL